jgi:hypothetical protein
MGAGDDDQHGGVQEGAREETRPAERDETPAERSDRNWNELLQELRVTQTGVQLLSGFLLTLPFQQRFESLTGDQKLLYLWTVVLSVAATGLIVSPVAMHRALFRRHAKTTLVTAGDRIAKAGLVVLAVTVASVLALIFSVVVGTGPAIAAVGGAALFFLAFWLVLPVAMTKGHRRVP